MVRIWTLLLLLSVFAPLAVNAAETVSAQAPSGFLVQLSISPQGTVRLESVASVKQFELRTAPPLADGWELRVLDVQGEVLWRQQHPDFALLRHGFHPDLDVPIGLRIPDLPGADSFEVVDADTKTRLLVALDDSFRQTARTERRRFEATLEKLAAQQAKAASQRDDGADDPMPLQPHPAQRATAASAAEVCPETGEPPVPERTHSVDACMVPLGVAEHLEDVAAEGDQAAKSTDMVTISGRLLDDQGQPLGVRVFGWTSLGGETLEADASGAFSIRAARNTTFQVYLGPAEPWAVVYERLGPFANDANVEIRLVRGISVSGRLNLPAGVVIGNQQPFVAATFRFANGGALGFGTRTQTDSSFRIGRIPPGVEVELNVRDLPFPYVTVPVVLPGANVDRVRDLTVIRGVELSGQLRDQLGEQVSDPEIYLYRVEATHWVFASRASIGADGRYRLALVPNRRYQLNVAGDRIFPQWLPIVRGADSVLDVNVERGVQATLSFTDQAGAPVRTPLQLGILSERGQLRSVSRITPGADGRHIMLAPIDQQLSLEVGGGEWHWGQPRPLRTQREDVQALVVLEPVRAVTVTVNNEAGEPVRFARVTAIRNGQFVVNGYTNGQGTVRLPLAGSSHRLEARVTESSVESSVLALGNAAQATLDIDATATAVTMTLPISSLPRMRLVSTAEPDMLPQFASARIELLQQGVPLGAGVRRPSQVSVAGQGFRLEQALMLDPGRYAIRLAMPGYPAVTSAEFNVVDGGEIVLPRPRVADAVKWRGTLRNPAGVPQAGLRVDVFDPVQNWILSQPTTSAGGFDVPLCPGCMIRFEAPRDGMALMHWEPIGATPTSRVGDVLLTNLPLRPVGAGLSHVSGDGRADRYNLLFLGDGYVEQRETFTDVNGNGQWDGVIFIDLDANGVWNDNEPHVRYGNAAAPIAGQDPTLANEPFVDLNGDGYPNLNDRQVFSANVHSYLRALFGYPYWRAYRGAFNASAYLAASAQAGVNVRNAEGELIIERNTMFNATWELSRSLLSIDYTLASQFAAEIMPSADSLIVLINQPVPVGRANSFILGNGGPLGSSPNSGTPSHEFGHKVGFLADEYNEFGLVYEGAGSAAPHLSRNLRQLVPWQDLLTSSPELPSPDGMEGLGVFEGGFYQRSGIYRPTHHSTMRGNSPQFNAPSIALLNERLAPRLQSQSGRLSLRLSTPVQCDGSSSVAGDAWWDVTALGVTRVLLRLDSPDGRNVSAGGATGHVSLGKWLVDGRQLFLLDAATGAVLDIETVRVARAPCPDAWLSLQPNPIRACTAGVLGSSTIRWSVTRPGITRVAVHLNDTTGPLFAAGGPKGSAVTGPWLNNGRIVVLVDRDTGEELAREEANVDALGCPGIVFETTPDPVPDCNGNGRGTARVRWDVRGFGERPVNRSVRVRLDTPEGTVLAAGGNSGQSAEAPWLTDGRRLWLMQVGGSREIVLGRLDVVLDRVAACQ